MTSPATGDVFTNLMRLWQPPSGATENRMNDEFGTLAKNGSSLLTAVQTAVQSPCTTSLRSRLHEVWNNMAQSADVDRAARGKAEAYLKEIAGRVDYTQDFLLLPGLWKGMIACAGLTTAMQCGDTYDAIKWMKRAVACWNLHTTSSLEINKIEGKWTMGSVPDTIFQGLLEQGWNVCEAWDLTHFLLTGYPRRASRTVDMRVLLVVESGKGAAGTLRLERLPDGDGFVRHPSVLLMPCDAEFLRAIDRVRDYANAQRLLTGGAIRWDLTLGDFVHGESGVRRKTPRMVQGGSLGGALALGMHLLRAELPESDLSIAVTAALLDKAGRLGAIAGAGPKFKAAACEASWPIRRILFPEGQDEIPNAHVLQDISVGTVADALTEFQADIKPRRVVLKQIEADCGEIVLPDSRKVGMGGALYQDVPLLQEADRQRRKLQDVLRGHAPRFVVLGPPGCGNTTMVRRVAWQVATDRRWLPWRAGHIVPAFIRLRQWAAQQGTLLPECLHSLYAGEDAPSVERWRGWLKAGNVLLLLDGLDEVGDISFLQNTVGPELSKYPICPVILTCRTVSRDRLSRVGFEGASHPVYMLAPPDASEQEAYVRAYPFRRRQDRDTLVEQVRNRREFQDMARTPGLLAILCFALDDVNMPGLPGTRTELYDIVVKKLLELPAEQGREVDLIEALKKPRRKREMLEDLSFDLSNNPQRPTEFSADDVQEKLDRIVRESGYTRKDADDLLKDLGMNSRLLMGDSSGTTTSKDYYYSHLTFQEFLVASALARRIHERGWEPEMLDRIDRYCWMPQWEETIIFLAGMLKLQWTRETNETDQRRLAKGLCDLLDLLLDESRDDRFRHRLALAALCLPEIADDAAAQ